MNIAQTQEYSHLIISVLLNTDFLTQYGTIVKKEYFNKPDGQVVEFINTYFNQNGFIPTERIIREKCAKYPNLDVLFLTKPGELDYAKNDAIEFVRQQEMKLAILQSVEAIKKGDLQSPLDYVKKAQDVIKPTDLGYDLERDIKTVFRRKEGVFPTGWSTIDYALDGGLDIGEYGLVMAPPGHGKTTMLINIGYNLASILCNKNVLHLTYEVQDYKVLRRYAARLTGTRINYETDESSFLFKFRKRAQQVLTGNLRVISPKKRSVSEIYRLYESLKCGGFVADVIIVDYPDLMTTGRRTERRFELADLTRNLRNLATDLGVAMWGATQARRQAISKEYIGIQDIAECIEKAAIADVILSLCRTNDEKKLGQGRIFAAKMRDAEDSQIIEVNVDFEQQKIVQRIGVL